MVISLHIPKVAGNSFLRALERQYGAALHRDYSDMPKIQRYLSGDISPIHASELHITELDHDPPQCIHGHFLPAKYLTYRANANVRFITWLREPVDRLVSHYNFFFRTYDPQTAGPLFKRIVEERWTLEKFCFSDEYRNVYSKYLWNFPLENFDFIGISEYYDEDLRRFSENFLQRPLNSYRLNCATEGKTGQYMLDSGFRRQVESFHYKDVELYRMALENNR